MLRKAVISLRLGVLELSHQMLLAHIVNEIVFATDIRLKYVYAFVVDIRKHVLWVEHTKLKLRAAEMIVSVYVYIDSVFYLLYGDVIGDWRINYDCRGKAPAYS